MSALYDKSVYRDAFNMLAGDKIGEGIHRMVFTCKIRNDLVVKVESDNFRFFANVFEMRFWSENQHNTAISKWLAPCEYMSPDGRIMLQKRARPLHDSDVIPNRLPVFLTDIKKSNFGFIGDQLVCVDYALFNVKPSTALKTVAWD